MRRRIEMPVGGHDIRIRDTVQNLAADPIAQASLYHFNLGYPAIGPGTTVTLGAQRLLTVAALADPSDDPQSFSVPAGSDSHAVCTVATPGAGPTITFTFATDTLPHLQLWHDFRPHASVLSIEPCTSAKIDGVEKMLQPSESRSYAVSVAFAP